jgi:hypothetical protein
MDMFVLVDSDYVVCTMSSNVCSVIYELMQTHPIDSTWKLVSLDSDYYPHSAKIIEEAVDDHQPENEYQIELKVGDKVLTNVRNNIGKHLKYSALVIHDLMGYKYGLNLRSGKIGTFPGYKTIE